MNTQWKRTAALAAAARPAVNLFCCGVLALGAAGAARANNLQITNVTVSGRNDTTAYVQFDIKWENSWRYASGGDPLYFHDAAWVFFKVLPDAQTDWKQVTLEGTGTNPTDYVVGSGTGIEMVVPTDRVGMFVRRSGDGAGTTSVQNVKAVWNFASNGLAKTEKVKVQAFGVEMAYVAEGSFKVGSGGTGVSEFYRTNSPGLNTTYEIGSEAEITVGTASGNLYYASSTYGGDRGGPIPAAFPKGYAAFYCMKYEITQGQYKDFLNTLTSAQDATRFPGWYNVNRHTITGSAGARTASAPDRACNYLSWADVIAFADWAGLRPMTELEFEKACRGPMAPVADEYAWGSTSSNAISGLQGTDGSGQEYYTAGNGNWLGNGGPAGPIRVGIFATNGASRVSAGASYWGIMELSGNLWERPVMVGHADGRNFTGLHGNGVLTTTPTQGDADVTNWPVPLTASGAGFRGGDSNYAAPYARASDRNFAALLAATRGSIAHGFGGRAVRSAP